MGRGSAGSALHCGWSAGLCKCGYRRPGLHRGFRGTAPPQESSFVVPYFSPASSLRKGSRELPFGPAVTQRNAGLGPRTPVTRSTAYQHPASSAPFFPLLSSRLPFPVGQQTAAEEEEAEAGTCSAHSVSFASKTTSSSSAAWPCACLKGQFLWPVPQSAAPSSQPPSHPSSHPVIHAPPPILVPSSAEGSSEGRQFLPDPWSELGQFVPFRALVRSFAG